MPITRSTFASACALIALVASVTGCEARSSDAKSAHSAAPDSGSPRGANGAGSRAGTSIARTVVITASDYSFTGVPARIHSGWLTLRLVNAGKELHMLGIARVPYGHSARAVLEAMANKRTVPETSDWGGPNAVSPGDTSTVALFFPPGEYAIACSVESADGKMHSDRGMMSTMIVTGAADSSNAPGPEDASVTLTDYHVAVHGVLAAGDRTIRVRNDASQGHDLEILEILPGHTEADAMRWFEHPARGTPTARAVGGAVEIHPGQQAVVFATLHPGRYLFLCWVPDDAGQPHFRRGMHQLVTVATAR